MVLCSCAPLRLKLDAGTSQRRDARGAQAPVWATVAIELNAPDQLRQPPVIERAAQAGAIGARHDVIFQALIPTE
jgi:hypothetical protein